MNVMSKNEHGSIRKVSPGIIAKQTHEIEARVLLDTSPVLNSLSKVKKEKHPDNVNVVEVDHVLDVMNKHLSKVKRRSVQAEFSNVVKHLTASLKASGVPSDVIEEEVTSSDARYARDLQ